MLVFAVFKPFGDKKLSHTAVENFITNSAQLGKPTSVTCNGGKDMTMTRNGQSFSCSAGGGKSYTVTIKDKKTGAYQVR